MKILANFEICISVPLKVKNILNKLRTSLEVKYKNNGLNFFKRTIYAHNLFNKVNIFVKISCILDARTAVFSYAICYVITA